MDEQLDTPRVQLHPELVQPVMRLAPGAPRRGVVREHLDGAGSDQPSPLGRATQARADGDMRADASSSERLARASSGSPSMTGATRFGSIDRW